jgi:hypothetical protein
MSTTWLWIDIPLCALFFLAVCGIPLWMVIRHPDTGPNRAGMASQRSGLAQQRSSLAQPSPESPQPSRSRPPARNPQSARSARQRLISES